MMGLNQKLKTGAMIISLAWGCLAAQAAPGVRAQVDRATVAVGESFTLSVTLEGLSASIAPNLPPIPSVNFGGVSQRSEFSIINGQQSSKQIFEYQLIATQPGDVTISAINVQAGGQIFSTQPVNVKVLSQGTGASPPGAGANPQAAGPTNLAFLRLVAPKKEAYLGEAFPVEIHLYFQSAQDIRMPQL